jgi:hypothetical protein
MSWEYRHPFTGTFCGNFCRDKVWFGELQEISVCQLLQNGIWLQVRQFDFIDPNFSFHVPHKHTDVDREVYSVPFSIYDPIKAVSAIEEYVQNWDNIGSSIKNYFEGRPKSEAVSLYESCFDLAMKLNVRIRICLSFQRFG